MGATDMTPKKGRGSPQIPSAYSSSLLHRLHITDTGSAIDFHCFFVQVRVRQYSTNIIVPISASARTSSPTNNSYEDFDNMAKIKLIEHFRVKPRWLFVKITDEEGKVGWGEGTLEGHDLAVEGALNEIIVRIVGLEAK